MRTRGGVARAETLSTLVRLLDIYRRLHANTVRWGQPALALRAAQHIVSLAGRIARLQHDARWG